MSIDFGEPVVVWHGGGEDPQAPLVVLLHGRGSDERSILGPWTYLNASGADLQAVRGPGGHGITSQVLEALTGWVADATAPRTTPMTHADDGWSVGRHLAG
jgi:predicted esterase